MKYMEEVKNPAALVVVFLYISFRNSLEKNTFSVMCKNPSEHFSHTWMLWSE